MGPGARNPPPARDDALLLHTQIGERFVGLGKRLGVLATIVKALRLVQLGDRPLHLRVVLVHLGGGIAPLLDHLRARAGERDTVRQGEAHGNGRDGQELPHVAHPLGDAARILTLNREPAPSVPPWSAASATARPRSGGGSGRRSFAPSWG